MRTSEDQLELRTTYVYVSHYSLPKCWNNGKIKEQYATKYLTGKICTQQESSEPDDQQAT